LYSRLYDGTSAYKIEEYYNYTHKAEEKRQQNKKTVAKKAALNRKRFIMVASSVFAVAALFLFMNVVLIQTAATCDAKAKELEDIRVRNTQLSFEIASGIDLAAVEAKAKNEFGMQQPESHQNVYVDVVQSDYAETFSAPKSEKGALDGIISSLKSFLSYIG